MQAAVQRNSSHSSTLHVLISLLCPHAVIPHFFLRLPCSRRFGAGWSATPKLAFLGRKSLETVWRVAKLALVVRIRQPSVRSLGFGQRSLAPNARRSWRKCRCG